MCGTVGASAPPPLNPLLRRGKDKHYNFPDNGTHFVGAIKK